MVKVVGNYEIGRTLGEGTFAKFVRRLSDGGAEAARRAAMAAALSVSASDRDVRVCGARGVTARLMRGAAGSSWR